MPKLSTQWNTGCMYTDEGQVIRADLLENRTIIFRDFSRGIAGALDAPIHADILTDYVLREFTMNGYLHNKYRYSAEAEKLTRL